MSNLASFIKEKLSKGRELKPFDVEIDALSETVLEYEVNTNWSMKVGTRLTNPKSQATKTSSAILEAERYAEGIICSPSTKLLNSVLGVIDKADISSSDLANPIQLNVMSFDKTFYQRTTCDKCNRGSCPCFACKGNRKSSCTYVTCYFGRITCACCSGTGTAGGYSNGSTARCNHCVGKGYDHCRKCSGSGYSYCTSCTDGTRRCGSCHGNGVTEDYYATFVSCVKREGIKIECRNGIDKIHLSEMNQFDLHDHNNGYYHYIGSTAVINNDGKTFNKVLRYQGVRKVVNFNINGCRGSAIIYGNKFLKFDRDIKDILPFTLDPRHIKGESQPQFLARLRQELLEERRIAIAKEVKAVRVENERKAKIREVLYDPIQITAFSLIIKSLILCAILLIVPALYDFHARDKMDWAIIGFSAITPIVDISVQNQLIGSAVFGIPIAIVWIFLFTRRDKNLIIRTLLVFPPACGLLWLLECVHRLSNEYNISKHYLRDPLDFLPYYIDALCLAPFLLLLAVFMVVAIHRRMAFMKVIQVAEDNNFVEDLAHIKAGGSSNNYREEK
jgi:hypothetical protein